MDQRVVILADDFTGACDAAAGFASTRATLVRLTTGPELDSAESAGALAFDLDLRELTDADALIATELAARQTAQAQPDAQVFLKIDSTLRGPLVGLIEGALRGSRKTLAVIAPAFPEQGRLLDAGRVVVNGQAGTSLPERLGLEGTALLGATFTRSAEEVGRAVEHARGRGIRRIVVDADGLESLASVAEAWQAHPEWLLVGSAGLARRVAFAFPPATRPSRGPGAEPAGGPILVVAGSPAEATRRQLEQLERTRAKDVVVLATPPANERDTGAAARTLAAMVAAWASQMRPRGLILAGGATARYVCERLGADGVWLTGELSPGVPIGHVCGGVWDGVRVVTKAGAFGNPETLLDAVHALSS